jgi:hypothetical protein
MAVLTAEGLAMFDSTADGITAPFGSSSTKYPATAPVLKYRAAAT